MEDNYVSLLAEKTPLRSAAKSSFVQKCISFGSTKKGLSYEDNSFDGFAPLSREQSISILSQGNEYNPNMSGVYDLDSRRMTGSPSVMKEDFTSLSKADFETTVFLDVDPEQYFADSLSEEFLEFFLSYSGEHEVFNLLLNYENLCCKGVETLSKACLKNGLTEKLSSTSNLLFLLQLERNTWRLLRILFQDRLEAEVGDEGELLLATMGKVSDKQIVDNLYQREAYIRQTQLVVDWLEKNADEDFQHTYFDKFGYFTDKCFSLEHSMTELMTSNVNQMNNKDKCCIEMDPDARFRQKYHLLHETDKENEDRLFKFMFIYVRAGKLDAAQQLAEKFGQPWIAAALEGWRLHHDPNYENQVMDGQELLPAEGNKYRDLWKSACWVASEQSMVPMDEQALYGSLCGNLRAVLSVCRSWEDYLWAYTKTSLDKHIEQEIRSCTQHDRSLEDLPVEYWDKTFNTEGIFQELEASNNDVQQECKIAHHIIQKYIILDDLGGLIEEMYSWLNNRTLDCHVLRLMTHIILFLRVIGRSTKEELCVPILEAYVQVLIKSRKVALVASYTSTLPKQQQIMWYAKFLEEITDNDERQKCLQYAEDAGLDVPKITKTVVKNIREKGPTKPNDDTNLSAVTTEEDLQKIHAIDWLIFSPNQRAEAVKQANALLRVFVAQRKLEAAKLLFSKIPEDSVSIMMQLSKAKGLEELSADDDNTTREYLCFKAYLEAMDAFNAWFHHSIHAKPKEPPGPAGEHVTFKEKVAHEHELQQYEKDLNRWKHVVNMLGMTASECLYNVLLFVNGGWMVDQRSEGSVDESRKLQLTHLRKLCIPHVSHLLQDLLITEERYKEAIQLTDIISSERYQLYKEFTHEDIKQLLRVTLDSSFSLLDLNMDPLGYTS